MASFAITLVIKSKADPFVGGRSSWGRAELERNASDRGLVVFGGARPGPDACCIRDTGVVALRTSRPYLTSSLRYLVHDDALPASKAGGRLHRLQVVTNAPLRLCTS